MGQVQHEVVHLALHTGDHRQRLPEIALGVARCMGQRHEHLPDPPPVLPDVVLDYGVLAVEPVLVPQPLEDPLRGVALLSGNSAIGFQDRVNYAGVRLKLRLARRALPRVALGRRIVQHLAHRVPVQVEHPGSLPNAHPLHQAGPPHPKIHLHVKHPSHLPQSEYQHYGRHQAVQFSTAQTRRSSRPRGTFSLRPLQTGVSGNSCISIWPTILIWNTSSSTARWSGPTPAPRERPPKGWPSSPGPGTEPRWVQHQGPCERG